MNALNSIQALLREHLPTLRDRRVVLAASGGGDSTAMVSMLCEAELIDPTLTIVAHFDHRLRDPSSSARDREVVDALCLRYGLRLCVGAWDAPRPGEAAARQARYAFLRAVAEDCDADAVLTGHTADDQIETVVMHAMRGAGLHGLSGMMSDAPFPIGNARSTGAPRLLRPLLRVTRAQTRAWCADHGIAYADDATNEDRSLLRNRVRLDVLRRVFAEEPESGNAILAMAATAKATVSALDAAALAAVPLDFDGTIVTLPRAALRALSAELMPYVYRRALVQLLGDARDIGRKHYAMLADVAAARTGAMFELPRNVVVTVDADALVLSLGPLAPAAVDPTAEAPLPFEGTLGAWHIDVARGDSAQATSAMLHLPPGAVIRARRPGDRLQPRGMRGHKKLQDYYVDRRVARRYRDTAPVIALDSDVLWTPYGAADQSAQAGDPYIITATHA